MDAQLSQDADRRLDLALRLVEEISALSLDRYQSPRLTVTPKPDGSLVTDVDQEAERRLRATIAREFPDDGVLGEEEEELPGTSGWRWVIDPIDGTESYIRGIPHFCTLIGIEREGATLAGVASFPAVAETLWARRGAGARWRTRAGMVQTPRVSAVSVFEEAVVEIGSFRAFERRGLETVRHRVVSQARRSRGWSDGYAYALVATGRVDAAVQVGLKLWDISAFIPIITEAGGVISDWTGAGTPVGGFAMASNGRLAPALVARLSG